MKGNEFKVSGFPGTQLLLLPEMCCMHIHWMNERHFLWSLQIPFLKYSSLMSLIVFLSCFPPFIPLWLSFFQLWITADPDHSPLLLFCSCAFKTQSFSFFSGEHFLKGLRWCSFQLFFWLSPLTWIGSAGLVSAACQKPDYSSQCV